MGECFMRNRGPNIPPKFNYTGTYEYIDDGNNNWRIKFKSSGTLTLSSVGNARRLDVFLVGGGSSPTGNVWTIGGGAGYTQTYRDVRIGAVKSFSVVVGKGGAMTYGDGNDGEASTCTVGSTVFRANGGSKWGNGGSGGGKSHPDGAGGGGSDGSDGLSGAGGAAGGTGQHTTTREFGEANGTLYAGGGGGAANYWTGYAPGGAGGGGHGGNGNGVGPAAGEANTGGGGGHTYGNGGAAGGSGIVVIRNHRR